VKRGRDRISADTSGSTAMISETDIFVDRLCGLTVRACLLTERSRVRFPAIPDFLSNIGSRTGSTQPL
jgi:hypothetical protein